MDKILVIQTAFIGDIILSSPIFEALKELYQDGEIYLLTTPKGRELMEKNPFIKEIIVYDKKKRERGIANLIRIIKRIRKIKFELAIIPHSSIRSALIAYLGKIPHRVGFSKRFTDIFYNEKVKYSSNLHQVERNLDLVYREVRKKRIPHLKIYISNNDRRKANLFLEKNKILDGDLLVGINPSSFWPTKRWKIEGFAEVADFLIREERAKVIIFGGPNDERILKEVSNNMKEKAIFAGNIFNLRELSAVIERCSLFISNDSAPMHIAMAMNVPTIAIFGPTTLDIGFGPYGERHIVVERKELECRPCSLHGPRRCPKKNFACMEGITSKEIIEAFRELLNRG
jgi:heptosyltransferase-2